MYPRGLGLFGTGAFLRESLALFARMSSPPSYARKIVINRTIAALIRSGVWAKTDALYVLAGHTSQASLLNWKSTSYNATNNGATFTTDRGFTGDAAAAYIETSYGIGDGQFALNDHHFGLWTRTAPSGNTFGMGATDAVHFMGMQNAVVFDGPSASTQDMTTTINHLAVTRTVNTQFKAYRNGANAATKASASSTFAEKFFLLARNESGSASSFSDSQIGAAHMGKALTAAEVAAAYSALAAYMTAVGA